MSTTTIEWAHPHGFDGETWNATLGCSKVSPGCKHCYAIRSVNRMAGNPNPKISAANAGLVVMTGAGLNWTGKVNCIPERLTIPLKKRRPTCWFVNSLSDLFHEEIPDEFIDQVFAVMALCPQHQFKILTKRAERMSRLVNSAEFRDLVQCSIGEMAMEYTDPHNRRTDDLRATAPDVIGSGWGDDDPPLWPLPNVHMGVSVENQATADERIPHLLQTPAAIRFVSYEPAIAPVDFRRFLFSGVGIGNDRLNLLHQIIVGGESGPDSRPFDIAWARQTIRQCAAADVACFVKQLGAKPFASILELARGGWPDSSKGWPKTQGHFGEDVMPYLKLKDKKGGSMEEWPSDLRVRQFPADPTPTCTSCGLPMTHTAGPGTGETGMVCQTPGCDLCEVEMEST